MMIGHAVRDFFGADTWMPFCSTVVSSVVIFPFLLFAEGYPTEWLKRSGEGEPDFLYHSTLFENQLRTISGKASVTWSRC